jgi:protein SCO1/2
MATRVCILAAFIFLGCAKDIPPASAPRAAADPRAGAPQPIAPARAPDLAGPNASGVPFRLSDERGHVALVSFGYTSCPDVCPGTLAALKTAMQRLDDSAKDVRVVFVSVDPERDRPARIHDYLASFDSSFIGLVLPPLVLAPTLLAWNVTAARRSPDSGSGGYFNGGATDYYSIDHTGGVFFVDRRGDLRLHLPFDADAEKIAKETTRLLDEPPAVRTEQARARTIPGGGALYLRISNATDQDDRLLAVTVAGATAQMHETLRKGDVMRMEPRPDGFPIPARGAIELAPGGKHIMFFGRASGAATPVDATLRFEHAGNVSVRFPLETADRR